MLNRTRRNWRRIHSAAFNNNTIDLGFFRLRFETAWVPPLSVLDRLKQSFPDLWFQFEWIDLDATFYERREQGELLRVPVREHPPHSWNYPKIDPYQHGKPEWLYSGIRLVAVLGPGLVAHAEAAQKFVFFHRDITDALLVIIPRLMEVALAAGDVPLQDLVEELLRSCGYHDFADWVARRKRYLLIRPKGACDQRR